MTWCKCGNRQPTELGAGLMYCAYCGESWKDRECNYLTQSQQLVSSQSSSLSSASHSQKGQNERQKKKH